MTFSSFKQLPRRRRDTSRLGLDRITSRIRSKAYSLLTATRERFLDRELAAVRLNLKTLGYEFARQQTSAVLDHVDTTQEPRHHGIVSGLTTQDDVESPWFSYWIHELRLPPMYHRKLWEFAIVLQTLHEHEMLTTGRRGVGFGCGEEPLASYFAGRGLDVLITDLDAQQSEGRGWVESGQHAVSKDIAFKPELVDRETFDRHVSHRFVDMKRLPSDLGSDYDFCWSVCAIEHLGSINAGMEFVINSLGTLRPGGIAVHTTEFNYLDRVPSVERGPTVLYRRKHIEQLAKDVDAAGGRLLGPDFDLGGGVLDRFIDLPPYLLGRELFNDELFRNAHQLAHLRLLYRSVPTTCFGIIVEKRT